MPETNTTLQIKVFVFLKKNTFILRIIFLMKKVTPFN